MPRILLAAAHKSSGKTVITTGLAAALHSRKKQVQCFKKGPDYIDPMWLGAASNRPCYNLDFNTMGDVELLQLYASRSTGAEINLIEANKGLYDGVDLDGRDSNAQLAKLLKTPVILIIDTAGMTRGIAPLLLGYKAFDPDINIAGVILNKVGGARHESKLRAAVQAFTDIPVVGSVWRNSALEIGERHLGLITPQEACQPNSVIAGFGGIMEQSIDIDALLGIAANAPKLRMPGRPPTKSQSGEIRIGIARDKAFGFYYPDDLEQFEKFGAQLVPINFLEDSHIPQIDGLFIGGGFPETQLEALSVNTGLLEDIKTAIEAGLPTYAECGGLLYLCNSLEWNGMQRSLAGVIPADAVMCEKPQGRGYAAFSPTPNHPWNMANQSIPAHEFHYARIDNLPTKISYGCDVTRGTGIDGQHDGICMHNLVAGFCHLRHTQENPWVQNFVDFAKACKAEKVQPCLSSAES